jgi:hypothetical protein
VKSTSRATVREQPGALMAESAREFERVQRASARVRDAQGDLAETQHMIGQIEQELGYRKQDVEGMALHMRRLTTLDF